MKSRASFFVFILALSSSILPGCGVWDDIFGRSQKVAVVDGFAVCDLNGDGADDRPADFVNAVTKSLCNKGLDSECPVGSFCDGGTCTFQCSKGGDKCAAGFCDCRGRCQIGDPAATPAGGMSELGQCPVDPALITPMFAAVSCTVASEKNDCALGSGCNPVTLKCNPRRCVWNDDCPYGASCNKATGTCTAECLVPGHACADSTKVCGCLGTCVDATASMVRPSLRTLGLSASPASLSIPGSASTEWIRPIDATVSLPMASSDLLDSSTGAERTITGVSVHVVAGANVKVACSVTPPKLELFEADCYLKGSTGKWKFSVNGQQWAGAERVWVASAGSGINVPGGWNVRLSSPMVTGTPQSVDIAFEAPLTTASGLISDVGSSWTGTSRFQGSVTLSAPSDSIGLSAGQSRPDFRLPVQAALMSDCGGAVGACLVINDSSGTLARSGQLLLPLNLSRTKQGFLPTPRPNSYSDGSFQGLVLSAGLTSLKRHVESNSLIGSFEIRSWVGSPNETSPTDPMVITAGFTATIVGDSCEKARDCPSGWSCSSGKCQQCNMDVQCGDFGRCVLGFCTNADRQDSSIAVSSSAWSELPPVSRTAQYKGKLHEGKT